MTTAWSIDRMETRSRKHRSWVLFREDWDDRGQLDGIWSWWLDSPRHRRCILRGLRCIHGTRVCGGPECPQCIALTNDPALPALPAFPEAER